MDERVGESSAEVVERLTARIELLERQIKLIGKAGFIGLVIILLIIGPISFVTKSLHSGYELVSLNNYGRHILLAVNRSKQRVFFVQAETGVVSWEQFVQAEAAAAKDKSDDSND